MAAIVWDDTGKRFYETGIDRGVLYIPTNGAYTNGVAWNGLTTVTEKPTGAAATPQYADNTKYLNLISAETFEADIAAFTYPDEFAVFDGTAAMGTAAGVQVGQQSRGIFGLSYRTKIGNDVDGDAKGYKLHLVYGCQAAPSQKAYSTVNDTPAPITFTWTVTTTPVAVSNIGGVSYKATSLITIDSTKASATSLAAFEQILYGSSGAAPALPLPDAVYSTFAGTLTTLNSYSLPTTSAAGVITASTTGVSYYVNNSTTPLVSGTTTFGTAAGDKCIVTARANSGYVFASTVDTTTQLTRTA